MKEIITKYVKYVILGLILIVGLVVVYRTTKKEQEDIVQLEPLIVENVEELKQDETIKQEIKEKIKVDIKGEIINPGVYELEKGSRVSDVIEKSGGLTENADTTLLNLSKNLKDEMVIVIYNKNEIEKLKKDLTTTKTVIEYIEKECTCPDTINDACIKEENKEDVKEKEEKQEEKETKISINKATQEELETLPSIGKTKAKAIIEYREKNGEFKDLKDITNVSGIGESTFEKFKEFITL